MKLLLRLLINAAALWVASMLIDGVRFGGASTEDVAITVVLVALIFGLVNAVIRPIVDKLACSLYLLTLGLFTFVVNALMLMLTSWVAGQFDLPFFVDGFIDAFLAGIIITVVSTLLSIFLIDSGKKKKKK